MGASIPNLHNSTPGSAKGSAVVVISTRTDALHSGSFKLKIAVQFNPAVNHYPAGNLSIKTDLSDSLKATFAATSIDSLHAHGKHTPTIYLAGRCKFSLEEKVKVTPVGCRYWIMIAHNKQSRDTKGTPDIVSFLIHDNNGKMVAYGTGPVSPGSSIVVTS